MNSKQVTTRVPTPHERAYVNLVRASDRITYGANALLKRHGLSAPQYNVLRILRGAGDQGLPCQKIGERLLTRVPDITRLLDRLEASGFVTRERGNGADRRVVKTTITATGLDKLAALDKPVEDIHKNQLSNLTQAEIETLTHLLARIIDE